MRKIWLYMSKKFEKLCNLKTDYKIKIIEKEEFSAIEFKMNFNILAFLKLKFNIPINIVAPPASIDCVGIYGSISKCVNFYKNKSKVTIFMNLDTKIEPCLKTLPTAIFYNKFDDFDDYLSKIRSSYRYRIKKALKKSENLTIKSINPQNFDNELYKLYLNVLKKSKYPLETLPIGFFRDKNFKIDVFYEKNKPIAFVSYIFMDNFMYFLFGGIDYSKRDEFDLYYNMLIYLIKIGIKNKVFSINLGQTAEKSKIRLGAVLEQRYITLATSNVIVNYFFEKLSKYLEYNEKIEDVNVFLENKS